MTDEFFDIVGTQCKPKNDPAEAKKIIERMKARRRKQTENDYSGHDCPNPEFFERYGCYIECLEEFENPNV